MSWTDMFIKKKEDSNEKQENSSEKEIKEKLTTINPVVNTNQNYNPLQNQTQTVGVDQKWMDKLQDIFANANMPGPDLYEFVMSVKKHDGKPIDEKTKFEMVYDALSSVGLTKAKLLESGATYINLFNDVKGEFEKEYQTKYQNDVTNLNAQAENVIQENASLQKQIEEINKKIAENLTKMQTFRTEATTNESRLMQEKMSFDNTHNAFMNNIQKYIEGVKTHIQ